MVSLRSAPLKAVPRLNVVELHAVKNGCCLLAKTIVRTKLRIHHSYSAATALLSLLFCNVGFCASFCWSSGEIETNLLQFAR